MYSPEGGTWVLMGDEQYNFSREEDPDYIPEWTKEAAKDQY